MGTLGFREPMRSKKHLREILLTASCGLTIRAYSCEAMRTRTRSGRFHMKQLKQAHQAPKFRDVMDSGSFSAPMERWVSLAAAVSRAEFEVATSRRDKWMKKLFESYELEVGDFDGLARWIGSNNLKMK